jgi:hypothetical protein
MESGEFTPFDDSQQVIYIPTDSGSGGADTLDIDPYRQGVEIKTNRQRFFSTQPKMWSGDLDHVVNTHTIGQARSFVEFDNSPLFLDLPEFDPVSYIVLGTNYPLPIIFNDGPQEEEETIIMPLTIPFRKNSNEGPFYAHRIAGEVDDGNDFDTVFKNANRTTQFWDYDAPRQQRYFLDEGQAIWGPAGEVPGGGGFFFPSTAAPSALGITTDGYTFGQERLIAAFDDTTMDDIPQSTRASSDLLGVLYNMKMNLDLDMRPSRTRSSGANTFVYGRDSAIYGTDSITFLGQIRGS